MTVYVRNPRGVIHAVPAERIGDHLRQPGMTRASLEDWLAQEGQPVADNTQGEPAPFAQEEVPSGVRRKRSKSQ